MEAPNPVLGFRDGLPEELMSKPRPEKEIVVRPKEGGFTSKRTPPQHSHIAPRKGSSSGSPGAVARRSYWMVSYPMSIAFVHSSVTMIVLPFTEQ